MSVYVIADAAGAPVEIAPGAGFTVWSVLVQTDADAAETGVEIGEIAAYQVSIPPGALEGFDAGRLAHFRIQVLEVPAAPGGEQEVSHTIANTAGVFSYVPAYEAIPPAPVPMVVSRVQGRLQLLADGRLATINTAVAGASAEIQEYWASTAIFRRDNAMLTSMWATLGLTSDELDATFTAAALIAT